MKLKELRSIIEGVEVFERPKILLEQYPTSPEIASHMIYTIEMNYEDISDLCIVDLGCGCGMLSIAAAVMGAQSVVGVEIDPEAMEVASRNIDQYDLDDECALLLGDVTALPLRERSADVVVMNPPFGTKKNKGIDVIFLQQALRIAPTVYSLHKTSTRAFLQRKATQEWGCSFEVVAELRFAIPQTYRCHKKKNVNIEVDFIRVSRQ